ncbi:hypothetical protein Tco_0367906 [Tanacetum coccineum]
MGDEHLSTIPKKESDEFIKSSVEDLILIPSESEDTSGNDSESDLPSCDDFSTINIYEEKSMTFSNSLFNSNDDFTSKDIESEDSYVSKLDEPDLLVTPLSKLNEDECFDPGGDFVLEEIEACLTSDLIPPGIDDDDFDPEGDILQAREGWIYQISQENSQNIGQARTTRSSRDTKKEPKDQEAEASILTIITTKNVKPSVSKSVSKLLSEQQSNTK